MIGAIRWSGIDYRFETEAGCFYTLLVSPRFYYRPQRVNERVVMEALATPDGSLMLYRILDVGYDVRRPSFVALRMLVGLW